MQNLFACDLKWTLSFIVCLKKDLQVFCYLQKTMEGYSIPKVPLICKHNTRIHIVQIVFSALFLKCFSLVTLQHAGIFHCTFKSLNTQVTHIYL